MGAVIIGSGSYIPTEIVSNTSFLSSNFYDEKGLPLEKANEEIIQKFQEITSISNRRYVGKEQSNSEIATAAAESAIEDAGIDKESLDYVIVAHNYGDIDAVERRTDITPSISARVKNGLKIKNEKCVPYDMIFGCPGWVEGMILADTLIKAGEAKRILVVGSETLSRAIDPCDRNAMIFADGAGAVVLEENKDDSVGIIAKGTFCHNQSELDYITNKPSLNPLEKESNLHIRMLGRKVYAYAVSRVPKAMKEVVELAGLSARDIDQILIHQANAKMDDAMVERFYALFGEKVKEGVTPMTVHELGNSSVATIPTLFDLVKKGKKEGYSIKSKDNVLMASVGAGMNINAILYREK